MPSPDFTVRNAPLITWVIAFSERTSAESAWLILSLSGALYSLGLVEIWTIIGCVSGIIFYWFVIAQRLRVVSEEYGAITLPQFFFKFSGKYGPAVRVVSMLIIVFFFSFYVAAQFIGAGKILNTTFYVDVSLGMPLAALIVILYTMMGGFMAVSFTDFVQAILMIITLVIMPLLGLVMIKHKDSISVRPCLLQAIRLRFSAATWAGLVRRPSLEDYLGDLATWANLTWSQNSWPSTDRRPFASGERSP